MNLWYKYMPNAVTRSVGRTALQTSKHSPTILFAGGVVGVIATAVMASRATLKVSETLAEHKDDLEIAKTLAHKDSEKYSEKEYQKDVTVIYTRMAIDVTKLYAPTIAVGIISIAALTKSHTILTRRNAALTAAYAALEKGFAEYRKRVVQEYGEEIDMRFRYGPTVKEFEKMSPAAQEAVIAKAYSDPNSYSVYARFFDETNRKFYDEPGYNFNFLRAQQQFANDMLHARGHIFLNEVYDMLGLDRTTPGSVVGWALTNGGDNYVDFGIFDADHESSVRFVNGYERAILLDFNVDGVIYDKI